MSGRPRPPEELRRAIVADLRPVRPLRPPALRAVVVAAWVPAGAALVLGLLGLRGDAPTLGWSMTLLPLVLESALGLLLVGLALAEAVPARGAARTTGAAALALAAVFFAAQAALTRSVSAGASVPNPLTTHGVHCFAFQFLAGVPAIVLTAFLVARAAPLHARWAGLLGGAGGGLIADGVYRLHCPITDLRHVLVWHSAGIAALAVAGLAAGFLWERRHTLTT